MPPKHELADLVQIEIPVQDRTEAGPSFFERRRGVHQLREHVLGQVPDKPARALPGRGAGRGKEEKRQEEDEAQGAHGEGSRFHWAGRVPAGCPSRLKSGRGGG